MLDFRRLLAASCDVNVYAVSCYCFKHWCLTFIVLELAFSCSAQFMKTYYLNRKRQNYEINGVL